MIFHILVPNCSWIGPDHHHHIPLQFIYNPPLYHHHSFHPCWHNHFPDLHSTFHSPSTSSSTAPLYLAKAALKNICSCDPNDSCNTKWKKWRTNCVIVRELCKSYLRDRKNFAIPSLFPFLSLATQSQSELLFHETSFRTTESRNYTSCPFLFGFPRQFQFHYLFSSPLVLPSFFYSSVTHSLPDCPRLEQRKEMLNVSLCPSSTTDWLHWMTTTATTTRKSSSLWLWAFNAVDRVELVAATRCAAKVHYPRVRLWNSISGIVWHFPEMIECFEHFRTATGIRSTVVPRGTYIEELTPWECGAVVPPRSCKIVNISPRSWWWILNGIVIDMENVGTVGEMFPSFIVQVVVVLLLAS